MLLASLVSCFSERILSDGAYLLSEHQMTVKLAVNTNDDGNEIVNTKVIGCHSLPSIALVKARSSIPCSSPSIQSTLLATEAIKLKCLA